MKFSSSLAIASAIGLASAAPVSLLYYISF